MLKINLPHSMTEYKISGVYKIQFSDGCFYIGCSTDLRSRSLSWNSLFENGNPKGWPLGENIINKINEKLDATFDIIELCAPEDLKDKEAFYLFENKDNPLMVSSWDMGAWKPVLQYKTDGLFIKRHMSISGAAKYIKSPIGRVQDVLYGIRKAHKGMIFVFEKDYGERRKSIVKSRYIRNIKKGKNRDVVVCDLTGREVNRYKTIVAASKDLLISKTCITDAINGRQKTSKGYIFKYA